MVSEFISGIKLVYNHKFPALSTIEIDDHIHMKIEVLKFYTYEATILSPRLKLCEYRGYNIVKFIFESLYGDGGYHLLPEDFRIIYDEAIKKEDKARIICDFIAGTTDRYAIEFYSRITSENPQTIYKPL